MSVSKCPQIEEDIQKVCFRRQLHMRWIIFDCMDIHGISWPMFVFRCLQHLATQKASVKLIPLMWFPEGGKPRLLISADGVMDLSSLAWFYRDQFEPIGWVFLLESAEKIHWHSWQVSHEHFLSISKLNRSKVRLTINVHFSRGSRFLLWQTRCHWGWTGVGDTDMWPVSALQCSHLFPLCLMIWHHERIRYANVYGIHCSYTTHDGFLGHQCSWRHIS